MNGDAILNALIRGNERLYINDATFHNLMDLKAEMLVQEIDLIAEGCRVKHADQLEELRRVERGGYPLQVVVESSLPGKMFTSRPPASKMQVVTSVLLNDAQTCSCASVDPGQGGGRWDTQCPLHGVNSPSYKQDQAKLSEHLEEQRNIGIDATFLGVPEPEKTDG